MYVAASFTGSRRSKDEIRTQAEDDQTNYNALNNRHDPFDPADALIAIAIALLALTARTHKRWLPILALLPTSLGILFGMAGLMGWHLHSDAIARLLSSRR
jgi:hypothetical protein